MKKFAIIGLPGSGKSTFSVKLGKILNIPVHHLDRHIFEADGKKRDKSELISIEHAIVNEESWIVEGCSMSTLGTRFAKADTVIYFQLPRLLCIWRVIKRMFTFNKTLEESGCLKNINWRLLKYIWTFERDKGPGINEHRKQHPHVNFLVFRRQKDADDFIATL